MDAKIGRLFEKAGLPTTGHGGLRFQLTDLESNAKTIVRSKFAAGYYYTDQDALGLGLVLRKDEAGNRIIGLTFSEDNGWTLRSENEDCECNGKVEVLEPGEKWPDVKYLRDYLGKLPPFEGELIGSQVCFRVMTEGGNNYQIEAEVTGIAFYLNTSKEKTFVLGLSVEIDDECNALTGIVYDEDAEGWCLMKGDESDGEPGELEIIGAIEDSDEKATVAPPEEVKITETPPPPQLEPISVPEAIPQSVPQTAPTVAPVPIVQEIRIQTLEPGQIADGAEIRLELVPANVVFQLNGQNFGSDKFFRYDGKFIAVQPNPNGQNGWEEKEYCTAPTITPKDLVKIVKVLPE